MTTLLFLLLLLKSNNKYRSIHRLIPHFSNGWNVKGGGLNMVHSTGIKMIHSIRPGYAHQDRPFKSRTNLRCKDTVRGTCLLDRKLVKRIMFWRMASFIWQKIHKYHKNHQYNHTRTYWFTTEPLLLIVICHSHSILQVFFDGFMANTMDTSNMVDTWLIFCVKKWIFSLLNLKKK